MLRPIVQCAPTTSDEWLVQLSCGHAQRRADQPAADARLDCAACERFELPPHFKPYKQTPLFTEATVPAGILNDHSTKAGVWARIHVVEGRLRYRVPAFGVEQELSAETGGIVVPEVLHSVQPLGAVRFFVEFYKAG